MKSNKQILKIAVLGFISFIINIYVFAQRDLTIYPMQSIPQSNYTNPALIPDCRLHIGCLPIGLPVLPSFYYGFGNSGFAYNDVVHKISNDEQKIDFSETINSLSQKNYLTNEMNMELLSFGFKIQRVHYVSLGLYERLNFRFCYPKDLISMLWYGNSQYIGKTMYFDGIGADMTHYHELALGYSYQHTDKWTFGGRVKLLFGLSNMWTEKTTASMGINEDYYDFIAYSGMRINVAGSEEFMNYLEDTTGNATYSEAMSPQKYIFNFSNPGFGIDFGTSYKINNKFSVAASLIDFGYIHWTDGARNYVSPDSLYIYDGFPVERLIRKDSGVSYEDVLKLFLDEVVDVYKLEKNKESYWGPLNPSIYISGFYTPTLKDKVSLVSRLDIYKSAVHPSFTLGYYRKFGKALSVAVNYSYYNRSWLNLGFGAALKVGPIQLFMTTDNVFAAITPYAIKNINLHFGANLVFYYKSYYPLLDLYGQKKSGQKKSKK